MRINKYLAKTGYATRRSADRLIEDGKVFVNGEKAKLGQKVDQNDKVEIKDFDTSHFQYVLYYKPKGVETFASHDEDGDISKQILTDHGITGLFPIGRLDKDTEGLIILTNDGRLTSKVLESETDQTYEVVVDKKVTSSMISHFNRGVKIESHIARPTRAKQMRNNANGILVSLHESKKYNVRSICAALGLQVVSLKRTKISDFELKNLKPGTFYKLKPGEIKTLYRAFGLR